jgi:integrase
MKRITSLLALALATASLVAAKATATVFNHLEKIVNPKNLLVLNSDTLSRFQAGLRNTGMVETSIATHLRHLRAALSWAKTMGFIAKLPDIQMPKRAKGRKLMRGRPLTASEFAALLKAVAAVRPDDAPAWIRLLNGLWLSGLRLTESSIVSWDDDSPFAIDLSGRRPRFRIYAEAEKGHEDRFLPMTPDFAEFLQNTPQADRSGIVFPLFSCTGKLLTAHTIGELVSAIGEEAGIIVNKAKQKFASSHDLRRSFGTRWASRVKPATLQLLMRHKAIETTMKYYVDQDADDVADELWLSHPGQQLPA